MLVSTQLAIIFLRSVVVAVFFFLYKKAFSKLIIVKKTLKTNVQYITITYCTVKTVLKAL
jgi:hypothetical protein